MPNRLLRDWTDSLRFDGITADAERLFTRLIMKADDYGRFHAEPRLIKASCFPLLENLRTPDLVRWLDELSTRHLILRYEAEGRSLLAIVNYGQRLKQSRAKFPPPAGQPADFLPLAADLPELPGTSGKPPPEGKGRESDTESEREGEGGTPPPADKTPAPPLSPATMMPVDRIKIELRTVYPNAPAHLTAAEMHDLFGSLAVLDELTPDDWLACRAWVLAPERIRGRKLWPRDRAEFVANAGQAIEQIREWWKKGEGAKWWNTKQKPSTPSPAEPPALRCSESEAGPEDPAAALRLWEELKDRKTDAA